MSKSKVDLSEYTGINARFDDPKLAAIMLENSTISRSVYRPGTVDYVMFDEAVVLNERTAEAIYTDFTPLDQPYARGSRVFLEKVADQVTDGLGDDRAKAIALMDWCRDIPFTYAPQSRTFGEGQGEAFHGGAEEEVIRKGSSMCNEQARVLCVLAQIAGIPSRYIGHMLQIDYDDPASMTGHGVNELYVDGAWAYFDIRGKFFQKADGSLASTWELICDPSIIDQQPKEVADHMLKQSSLDKSRKYLSPDSVQVVVNYLAADHGRYDYSWVYPSAVLGAEARDKGRALRVTKHATILPQPKLRVV